MPVITPQSASPPISAIAREMMARELAKNPQQFDPKPGLDLGLDTAKPQTPMSPELAATLGAAADIAGTYEGMKHTGLGEDNAMYAGGTPGRVATGLLGQLAAQKLATGVLRKIGAKGLADAIAANAGAYQLGLGSKWGQLMQGQPADVSGYDAVNGALDRAAAQRREQR